METEGGQGGQDDQVGKYSRTGLEIIHPFVIVQVTVLNLLR